MFTAKATRLFSILLLLGTVFLNSCKKGDDVTVVDPAYFRIINVSPSLGTYNVYINDQILTTAALPFGGVIPYKTFEPAAYSLKFTTASSITSLLTKQVTLKSKELSSFYLIEKPGQLDGLIVADGVQAAVSTQKTSIRFINLSPDAPALDLTIVGGTSVTTNKGYKSFSTYAEFDAKKYSFEIKDSTTGAVKATLTDLDLVAGRLYTIIARGLVNPGTNEQPFTAQSIIN